MKRPRWTRPYWIIDHLPLSRGVRLRWLRTYLDRAYGKDLAQARRRGADAESVMRIHDEYRMELSIIDDEVYRLLSDDLLNRAYWFRVPVPPARGEKAELTEDWTRTEFTDTAVLSETGIVKLRERIRVEEKWRQERRAHWVSYVAAFTGLIGAATGLATVLHTNAKKDEPPTCVISVDSRGTTSIAPPTHH